MKLLPWIFIILLAAAGSWVLLRKPGLNRPETFPAATAIPTSPSIQTDVPTLYPSGVPSGNSNIIITSPLKGETVSAPFIIQGQARVFENQFSWRVRSDSGTVIASGNGMSDASDAGQFGNFSVTVPSLPAGILRGTVEVYDNSPRDGSEIDLVSVPVSFGTAATLQLNVYFGNSLDKGQDCERVFPVPRTVDKTVATARAALTELFRGPTGDEQANGYFTSINPGVVIRKLTIDKNGVASADFSGELEKNVGGSCRVSAIRSQITRTLEQFPTVKSVVISVDGRTEDILQP